MTARLDPDGPRRASPAGVAIILLALVVAACSAATVSPSVPASAGPGASASGSASDGGGGLEPSPSPWPGPIIEAVLALAKADAEIQAAGADLGAAAAHEDLKAMWGAADGLATLVKRLQGEVPRIADYPETAAAAQAYDAALPVMLAGATTLRDAITAGDAAKIAAGSQQLAAGLDKYAAARRLIGPLADQAILMTRILVK